MKKGGFKNTNIDTTALQILGHAVYCIPEYTTHYIIYYIVHII